MSISGSNIIGVHPSMPATNLTEIVFITIFAENQSTSWRESSCSTNFFDPQLDNRPHLWSSRLKTFQPAVQEGKPDELSVPTLWLWKIRRKKILYDTQQFLSPRWNAKRFHSAQVLISITENEKSQARCWISWWGDGTETLSVLRSKRKAGIGCYVTLLFLGDICLHQTFVIWLAELPKQINLPCYFELKWHVMKLVQLHNWHRTKWNSQTL